MNYRIGTTAVVLLLLIPSVALIPGESQGGWTSDSPEMIAGDETAIRYIDLNGGPDSSLVDGENNTIPIYTFTAYAGVNWNSFRNPSITIKTWVCDTYAQLTSNLTSPGIILMENNGSQGFKQYADTNIWAKAERYQAETHYNGMFAVTFAATGASAPAFYKFEIILKETVANMPVEQSLYCGAHVSAAACGVQLKDGTNTVDSTAFRIEPETPYQSKVVIGNNEYGSESYYFYAAGLPDGINMKLDGIIVGKTSSILMSSQKEGDAVVCAVSKLDSTEVHSLNVHYLLPPGDSFEYVVEIDGVETSISCSIDGYVTAENTKPITITVSEVNPNADISASDYTASWTLGMIDGSGAVETPIVLDDTNVIDNNKKLRFVLNGNGEMSGFTGEIQMHLTKTVINDASTNRQHSYTSTLHIMVIGPVVHSGLSPIITSQ